MKLVGDTLFFMTARLNMSHTEALLLQIFFQLAELLVGLLTMNCCSNKRQQHDDE